MCFLDRFIVALELVDRLLELIRVFALPFGGSRLSCAWRSLSSSSSMGVDVVREVWSLLMLEGIIFRRLFGSVFACFSGVRFWWFWASAGVQKGFPKRPRGSKRGPKGVQLQSKISSKSSLAPKPHLDSFWTRFGVQFGVDFGYFHVFSRIFTYFHVFSRIFHIFSRIFTCCSYFLVFSCMFFVFARVFVVI